ncbi:hypothetical protein [Flavihumibacter sp. CACIAM 22H1]|uniref:hypothetical protein n=1 Tax=Flavihumibacter sp. CACIAM 22H1 TaxID=1812911 RepID=UPI0007A7F389|nr:hypothetical protein [Flavihumibacter sp. CACIAM 22H1]KYP14605.1 MAG: hypothetical protein A1D16_15905 [Flavihumibacter sp. CACIAM 22H1]
MRPVRWILFLLLLLPFSFNAEAQCSICTKTAQQMGEKPAKALNSGIIYLAATPLALMGFIGYRWWKSNRDMF